MNYLKHINASLCMEIRESSINACLCMNQMEIKRQYDTLSEHFKISCFAVIKTETLLCKKPEHSLLEHPHPPFTLLSHSSACLESSLLNCALCSCWINAGRQTMNLNTGNINPSSNINSSNC